VKLVLLPLPFPSVGLFALPVFLLNLLIDLPFLLLLFTPSALSLSGDPVFLFYLPPVVRRTSQLASGNTASDVPVALRCVPLLSVELPLLLLRLNLCLPLDCLLLLADGLPLYLRVSTLLGCYCLLLRRNRCVTLRNSGLRCCGKLSGSHGVVMKTLLNIFG
jgi:hypothetical protein